MSLSNAAFAGACPGVRRSRARGLIIASFASLPVCFGSAGCGGRTALDVSGGITVASDGGGPGAALDDAAAGNAEDARSVATVDAGDATTCTTPGIYLVTGPSQYGPYSLAVFDPTTGELDPSGSIDAPGPPLCSDGAPITSVAITRAGQITITCFAYLFHLDENLAPTSPIYEWPRVGGEPWGSVEMTVLGLADAGQLLLGLGPALGLAEFEFDASSPVTSISMFEVNELEVSGSVDAGPLLALESPLAATGDGRLFALSLGSFWPYDAGDVPVIVQIDPFTAEAIAEVDVPVTWEDIGHPVAFWAGDFYTFPASAADAGVADTGATMQTEIVRLHPGANTRETVATVEGVVVAASSSPCAPTH